MFNVLLANADLGAAPAADGPVGETVLRPESFSEAFTSSFNSVFSQLPYVLAGVVAMLVVLIVGYAVAKLVSRAVVALSDTIGLERAADRSGLAQSMKKVGIERGVSWILGQIVFWLLMSLFLATAFNLLGLETVSTALEQVVSYIPRLLVAAVVVIIGLLVASLVRGVIATAADRVGITYAERLAGGCYWVLALMTFLAAFDQLGIELALIKELILIAFAALAFGFALAFGLGGRDVMGGILAGYYTRQRLHAGDRVSVAGMTGTVREVGPVATVIETEEEGLMNRHSIPNSKMLSEAVR